MVEPNAATIANLLSRHLDRRLTGLASAFGASYTRYADDLAFSGDAEFRRDLRRFVPLVKRILKEERLPLEPSKLRFARKGARQKICGVTVNTKVNGDAEDYRNLRALLYNCAKHGSASQDRRGHADFRAHLQGRIAFHASLNPRRGEQLRERFQKITF